MRRNLFNRVYYQPVGHLLEEIHCAKGFHDANPGSEVGVALAELRRGNYATAHRGSPGYTGSRRRSEQNDLLIESGQRPEGHEPEPPTLAL